MVNRVTPSPDEPSVQRGNKSKVAFTGLTASASSVINVAPHELETVPGEAQLHSNSPPPQSPTTNQDTRPSGQKSSFWSVGASKPGTPPEDGHVPAAAQKQAWKIQPLSQDQTWHSYWAIVCVVGALVTAFIEPIKMAFAEDPGLYPYNDWLAVLEYLLEAVFAIDIVLNFLMEREDSATGMAITDFAGIAQNYLKTMFFPDLLFMIPFDEVVLAGLGLLDSATDTALLVGLLKLLKLGRLYRMSAFVAMIEYKMLVPQVALILLRNNMYALGSCHLAACVFYLIARLEHFGPDSWVGANRERFDGTTPVGRYILSLYFSTSVFTGLGDGAMYVQSVSEAAVMIVYLLYNMLMGAYILGTVTMLMVKSDTAMALHRERVTNLREYARLNDLPTKLVSAMEEHLQLHEHSEQANDEQVLALYPMTIRKRVLRQLYIRPIKACHLFAGNKAKFLDAVLSVGRIDLFMPRVQVIADGEIITEMFVLLEGEAERTFGGLLPAHMREKRQKRQKRNNANLLKQAKSQVSVRERERQSQSGDGGRSAKTSGEHPTLSRRQSMNGGGGSGDCGSGDHSAEVGASKRQGLLQRNASMDSMDGDAGGMLRRVSSFGSDAGASSIGGSSWNSFTSADMGEDGLNLPGKGAGRRSHELVAGDAFGEIGFFTELPSQESVWSSTMIKVLIINKTMYEELLGTFPQQTRKMLENMERHAEETVRTEILGTLDSSKRLTEDIAEALHLLSINEKQPSELAAGVTMEMRGMLRPHQREMLDNLPKVKDALARYVRRVDQNIVYEFLNSCSAGDEAAVRHALGAGMSPNAADYDARNGLMLACHEGHDLVARVLLEAGADPGLKDNFGSTCMFEAVKMGHDNIVELLLEFGGTLGMDGAAISSQMCNMVKEGDLVQLKRMLRAGANPNMPDYNGMTPLHVAAVCANLPAAKLLITEGAAKVDFRDVFGHTALDEARRTGNQPMVEYLEPLTNSALNEEEKLRKAMAFLNFCAEGNLAQVRSMLNQGQDPDTADYDVRTGLMLACHEGHESVVKLLLQSGADPNIHDSFGYPAMWECVKMGRPVLIDIMLQYGGVLDISGIMVAANMNKLIREGDLQQLSHMLRARCDPDQSDSLGSTPLHVASALGSLTAARLLVESANATVDCLDAYGHTPLDNAQEMGHMEIVEYLEPLVMAAARGVIKSRDRRSAPPATVLLMGSGLPKLVVPKDKQPIDFDKSPAASLTPANLRKLGGAGDASFKEAATTEQQQQKAAEPGGSASAAPKPALYSSAGAASNAAGGKGKAKAPSVMVPDPDRPSASDFLAMAAEVVGSPILRATPSPIPEKPTQPASSDGADEVAPWHGPGGSARLRAELVATSPSPTRSIDDEVVMSSGVVLPARAGSEVSNIGGAPVPSPLLTVGVDDPTWSMDAAFRSSVPRGLAVANGSAGGQRSISAQPPRPESRYSELSVDVGRAGSGLNLMHDILSPASPSLLGPDSPSLTLLSPALKVARASGSVTNRTQRRRRSSISNVGDGGVMAAAMMRARRSQNSPTPRSHGNSMSNWGSMSNLGNLEAMLGLPSSGGGAPSEVPPAAGVGPAPMRLEALAEVAEEGGPLSARGVGQQQVDKSVRGAQRPRDGVGATGERAPDALWALPASEGQGGGQVVAAAGGVNDVIDGGGGSAVSRVMPDPTPGGGSPDAALPPPPQIHPLQLPVAGSISGGGGGITGRTARSMSSVLLVEGGSRKGGVSNRGNDGVGGGA